MYYIIPKCTVKYSNPGDRLLYFKYDCDEGKNDKVVVYMTNIMLSERRAKDPNDERSNKKNTHIIDLCKRIVLC